MIKGFAIHNAPTDHGGIIPSTQVSSSQQGNLFVRAGDGHMCPKCKCWSTIIPSPNHVIFDGKPVAYAGDKLTCGAKILPQQSHVVGDSENYHPENNDQTSLQKIIFDEQLKIIFNDESDEIFKYLNCKIKIGDKFYDGGLNSNGKTTRFSTEKAEPITEIEFELKNNIVYFHEI